MKVKQLLLTFDYELFLGKNSGSVFQCMLEPTEKIIPILKKHGLKAVFFIDTTYLMQLEKQALSHSLAKNDLNQIKKQLNNLIEDGHHLFHHLHPHWLDAIYNPASNTWDCSNHTHFALSNLTDEQVASLFTYSDDFIRGLYPEKNKPAFLGFRAGGLYSQPFERLSQYFKAFDIRYDFSVLKGASSKGLNYSFDYRSTATIIPLIYNFNTNNKIADSTGVFTEIALENFSMTLCERLLNSIYYRLNSKKNTWQRLGDGISSGNRIQSQSKTSGNSETYSIELLNRVKSFFYASRYKKTDILHIISHPKLLSTQSIRSFELFLNLIHEKYTVISDFNTIISDNPSHT